MAECATTPTLTTSVEQTGQTVFETTFTTVSTAPPELVTSLITTAVCSTNTTAPASTSCATSVITSVVTVPGETVPVTLTIETTTPVTSFVPTTLFGTSCPPNQPSPPPPSSPPPVTTSDSSSSISSITSSSSSSSSSLPSSSDSSSTTSAPTGLASDGANHGAATNVGPIVGGTIGGFVGLVAIVMVTYYFFKRSGKRFDNIFNRDLDLEDDLQPIGVKHTHDAKPGYHYNLVGQDNVNPSGQNPLSPPPKNIPVNDFNPYRDGGFQGGNFQETGYQDNFSHNTGYQPSNETGPYTPDTSDLNHVRNPSLGPLLGGVAAAAAAGGAGQQMLGGSSRSSTTSGRPSTTGSTQPLIQQGYPPQPQQQYYANAPISGYPPQAHGQLSPQGYGYPPSSSLSHNISTGSGASAGGSSGNSMSPFNPQPQYGLPPPGIITTMGGAAAVGGASGQRHARAESESSLGRSGSPVSIQNQGVLQIMNPEASTSYDEGSSSALAIASGSGGALASSSSSTTVPSVPVDGKGRPVNTRGEKAPIVHLDGGRYEEPIVALEGTTQPPSGPAPPAYSPQ